MQKVDLNYFPGWVRKSMSFTIDDGNTRLDRKFMDYVKPAGIKGTFNLSTPLTDMPIHKYPELYRGFEIADHCRYHAYALTEETSRPVSDEPFDPKTADRSLLYRTREEGIWRVYTYSWCWVCDDDRYIECVQSARRDLETVFGKGTIRGYIWPCGEQKNDAVIARVKAMGFDNVRIAGGSKHPEGYGMPGDRSCWCYTANYTCMEETGAEYEALPDDGKLKFYCFGVHSHDFENAGRWDVLENFCKKYGNRPETFWYATVSQIFDYEDAVNACVVTENAVANPSPIDLYITVDGVRQVLGAGETLKLD